MYMFGSGTMTIGGTTVGTFQSGSLDIEADQVELHGAYAFAVDVASGKRKVSGKVSQGEIQQALIAQLIGDGTNPLMGAMVPFAVSWTGTYRAQTATFTLNACSFKKMAQTWGNDKHMTYDIEFAAFADDANHVLTITATA